MTQKPNNDQLKAVKYEDAVAASKVYFQGDDLAAQVWVSKYALKDSFGNTLAPLLVPSYKRIVLADPRYYRGSVADLCKEQGADEILFCYSLERIATDLNLSILK